MDTYINQITAFIDTYKRNSKLNKKDQLETQKILKLLLISEEYLDQALEFLFRLPAETVSESFVQAWSESNEELKNQLIKKLLAHKLLGDKAGMLRELLICKKFIPISPEVASKVLADWCLKATKDAQKLPSLNSCDSFKKYLINGNKLLEIPIPEDVSARDLTAISITVLYTLLLKADTPENSEMVDFYFDWLMKSDTKYSFNTAISNEFYKIAEGLPEKLQDRLYSLNVLVDNRKDFSPSKALRILGSRPGGNNRLQDKEGQPKTEQQKTVKSNINAPVLFDFKESLKNIQNYIVELEGELAKFRVLAKDSEKNYEHEKNHRISIQCKLQETAEQLEFSQNNAKMLQNELYQIREENKSLKAEIDNMKSIHKNKVEDLLDMSEHSVSFAVKEFQNVLSREIRLEYEDFMNVINEEITKELSENFKAQLINIFTILKTKGLKL